MPSYICRYCGKIYNGNHTCDRKTEAYNERKREYNRTYTESKELRTSRWAKFRKSIINRDNGRCQRCLIKYNIITVSPLEVHHIVARVHDQSRIYDETNTITLCKTCNLQLGIQDKLDFEWEPPKRQEYKL